MEKLIIAHFTEREMAVIQTNIQELSQNGRMGNADSIAMRFESAMARAKNQAEATTPPEKDDNPLS